MKLGGLLPLVICALLAGSPAPSRAAATHLPACTAASAEAATVRRVAGDQKAYRGRCVTISGVVKGLQLYDDVNGVYQRIPDVSDPSSSGAALGLDNPVRLGHLLPGYRVATITGRVQDCDLARRALDRSSAPGEVAMIVGYCHYRNGAYLWVTHISWGAASPPERRMGAAAGDDYGDLVPAPADWPHRPAVQALAARFLRALRTGDAATLANLHFEDPVTDQRDDARQLVAFLLRDGRSPFASIRTAKAEPQGVILVRREANDDPDDYSAFICFCRSADCTGRWPIATFDADNLPSRPYACTMVEPYLVFRQGKRPMFRTPMERYGLSEPSNP